MKLLVAIPCYNCASQIPRVLTKLSHDFPGNYDVLVLDNGSSDETLSRAKESLNALDFQGDWKLCQNENNYGLGGSQKLTIKIACDEGYDALIVLHGDDQASPSDISRLISIYKNKPKTVLGSRFMAGSILSGYQIVRALGNRALNFVFSIICLRRISDLGSGLNLFRVNDLAQIEFTELSDSFNFNVDLLLKLIEIKAPLEFSPIHWSETDQVSNARNFKVATSMLTSLIRWKMGIEGRRHLAKQDLRTHLIASKA